MDPKAMEHSASVLWAWHLRTKQTLPNYKGSTLEYGYSDWARKIREAYHSEDMWLDDDIKNGNGSGKARFKGKGGFRKTSDQPADPWAHWRPSALAETKAELQDKERT